MKFAVSLSDQKQHVLPAKDQGLKFNPGAREIAVFDRRGKTLWKKVRSAAEESICWDGVDLSGCSLLAGQHLLKICYPDQGPVYLPFIVM